MSYAFRGFGLIAIGESIYPCEVLDRSRTGATLRFKLSRKLPPNFFLQVDRQRDDLRECAVIWQDHDEAGVLFI